MKVLVIGGNRFVGKRLVELLKEQGHALDVLNRGHLGQSSIKVDRTKADLLKQAVQNKAWDIIFDFACYTGNEAHAACEVFKEKAKRYIFISTQSVYRAGEDIKESGGGPSPNDYARDKFEAEIEFSELAPWPMVMVRFPILLGLDDYTQRLYFHVERVKKGLPIYFPNLEARISFLRSSDAANFLSFLIKTDFEGPVNCASPDPVRLKTLMSWIEDATGARANYAHEIDEKIHSPFGIEKDWWMNTDKMQALGFGAQPCVDWLPELVKEINKGL